MNKNKIINDPVYGFISVPQDLIFKLINHPWFQRLRRIKQLGLTHYVYPGALHTRFHHALGALHLMSLALDSLRVKGVKITDHEYESALIAILLHDIGHGPFSHSLENLILPQVSHEKLSLVMMQNLNNLFEGKLETAISIFEGTYPKAFLHQLVSSQLDVDRLDYLRRDSFYTGVIEGFVGVDRIIQMMDVVNNELVIEVKGIYSIEKFLIARRLMYWQVYLHKTVVSVEKILINILKRARELIKAGEVLWATPAFSYFLNKEIKSSDLDGDSEVLANFALLDDFDVIASVKIWMNHPDFVLSTLCTNLINRDLLKISFFNEPVSESKIQSLRSKANTLLNIPLEYTPYFVFMDKIENRTYSADCIKIKIAMKDGSVKDISEVSDQYDLGNLTKNVTKYFLCYPAALAQNLKDYEI